MMNGVQQPGDREGPPIQANQHRLSVHSGPGSWPLSRQTELQVLFPAWGTTIGL